MRRFLLLILLVSLSCLGYFRGDDYFFKNSAISGCSETKKEPLYHFLSEGKQSYVFLSEDGQTVLKLFKRAYFEEPWYFSLLGKLSWKERKVEKKKRRRQYFLESYKVAFEWMRDETGLLFVKGEDDRVALRLPIELKSKRVYEIDCERTALVLQKKGEPFQTALKKSYQNGGQEGVFAILDSYFALVQKRIEKKISDKEQNIIDNFGVNRSHQVFHLDPGRYLKDETLEDVSRKQEEWKSAMKQIRSWIRKEIPELLDCFDERASFFSQKLMV